MKDREDRIAHHRNYCVHYKPNLGNLGKDYCAIGCGSRERMDAAHAAGEPNMTPCIGGHSAEDPRAICPKWERRSREAGEKYADSVEDSLRRFCLLAGVLTAWRTWTTKNRVGKQEVIECPACKGRLHLSQSSYNGHVRGQCETADCINFIE